MKNATATGSATPTRLKAGDTATAMGLRTAHVIRSVDDGIARTMCKQITLWSRIGEPGEYGHSWIVTTPEPPMCRTCSKRLDSLMAGRSRL